MYNEAMVIARRMAEFSNCNSRKIGCVILDKEEKNVVGIGQNHTSELMCIRGECRKRHYGETEHSRFCDAIHAEESAVLDIANEDRARGGTAVMTCGYPCRYCLVRLHEVGVRKLVLGDDTFYTPLDERFFNANRDWFEVEIYRKENKE